ncbi:MAG: GAF domain-containing protein [Anaerolineae bacterium]|jgi:two-component system, OmpR family, phosphate regulon sensor histidine kinase PhoR|nr:GAF domain-containing protein [Anaerolineae bacterium]MBT7072779.1 GAF domain-containing protein [Anaerolineae bacterium]MBT7323828.1 GAF domain-containing protein [Anaerolineae bacterium]
MTAELIILALDESTTLQLLSRALRAVGYTTVIAHDRAGIEKIMQESHPALLLLGTSLKNEKGTVLVEDFLKKFPTLPIIFLATDTSAELIREALRAGVSAYLEPPLKTDEIIDAVKSSLLRAQHTGDWMRREVKRNTTSLEKRISELEVLLAVGRDIASSLDVDTVLNNVVSAAVKLTSAEEGSLLLLDEESNELYMRAGHNFEEGFINNFRLPVTDTLAGQVIETGEALSFNKDSLHKIKTAYLVQALIYVPLKIKDRIIGVLGVDNRKYQLPFSKRDTLLLSLLADYAAVAIDNASLYQASDMERSKFEAVLSNMDDALMIIDHQERIQLINEAMCSALNVQVPDVRDKVITDVITQGDILNLLRRKEEKSLRYHEVNLDDNRIFSAQYTPIQGVGAAITMQDISYLKELNRLKDDFVHTVSHDLRSPLTAVLGYTELLERVGSVNEQQAEFVHRIQESVKDITALIDDLLDLGRIEAGFDMHRESIHLDSILRYTLSNLESLYTNKKQVLEVEIAPTLPLMHGNPVRLRQMFDNLINNAIKYTPEGKIVSIKLHHEGSEIIFRIEDQGSGISPEDQPHIFEKFYRAKNAVSHESGSGLGLAIVKTIVESHQGRIWVQTKLGVGSVFTVVLPS